MWQNLLKAPPANSGALRPCMQQVVNADGVASEIRLLGRPPDAWRMRASSARFREVPRTRKEPNRMAPCNMYRSQREARGRRKNMDRRRSNRSFTEQRQMQEHRIQHCLVCLVSALCVYICLMAAARCNPRLHSFDGSDHDQKEVLC